MSLLWTAGAAANTGGDGGGDGPIVSPGGHRYWRMSINDSGDWPRLGYWELRQTPSGEPIPVASISANQQANSYPEGNSLDRNPNSYWRTASEDGTTYPVTLTIDTGAGNAPDVQEVMMLGDDFSSSIKPRYFDIQWSDDGSTWTTRWSVTDDDYPHENFVIVHTDPAADPVDRDYMWDEPLFDRRHVLSVDQRTFENVYAGNDYRRNEYSVKQTAATNSELLYAEFAMGDDGVAAYDGYVGIAHSGLSQSQMAESINILEYGCPSYRGLGQLWNDDGNRVGGLPTYGSGDVAMLAFRPSTREMWVGANGVWGHDPDTDPASYVVPSWGGADLFLFANARDANNAVTLRVREEDFDYAMPAGAVAFYDAAPPADIRALTVTNGDFETGDLTGWTQVTSSWATSDPLEGYSPYQGSYSVFVASSGNPARLRQDIDITTVATEAEIDAGASFTALCYGVHTTSNDSDRARLSVTPLDGSGTALAAATTTETGNTTWTQLTCSGALPTGTRTLRVELLGTVAGQGSTSNAGFDAVQASVTIT